MLQRRRSVGTQGRVLAAIVASTLVAASLPIVATGHPGSSPTTIARAAKHRSCPRNTVPAAGASNEALIPAVPVAMVFCEEVVRYTVPRGAQHPTKHVLVFGPRSVTATSALQSWAASFNALPLQSRCPGASPGVYSCPAVLVGSKIVVTVKYQDEPSLVLTIGTNGRRTVERAGAPARSANNTTGRLLIANVNKLLGGT